MSCKNLSKILIVVSSCFLFWALLFSTSLLSYAADNDSKLKALESAYQAGILSENEYRMKKAEITGSAQEKPKTERINSAPAKQAGTVYRHPTGISFWYPSDWSTKMLSGILQLVPPGAGNSPETYETYYITAENVANAGITDPNHPAVFQYLENQMLMLGQELGVFFQRSGTAIPVTTSQGNGIRIDWAAQSNIGPVKARTYVSIIRNYGLVIAGVGVKNLLSLREKDILQIFSSFGVGKGKLDFQLAGTWHLTSTHAIQNNSVWETDYSRAKLVSESNSTLTFNPDGTWTREDKSQMIAGAGSVWIESNENSIKKGQWNAENGHLFMLWEDESFEEYSYKFERNQLKMVTGKTGQIWTRVK